jgi:hypothetical protein
MTPIAMIALINVRIVNLKRFGVTAISMISRPSS